MNRRTQLATLFLTVALLLAACGTPQTAAPVEPPITEPPAAVATEVPTEAPAEEPPAQAEMCMGAQPGDEISLMYQWSGQEEERLN